MPRLRAEQIANLTLTDAQVAVNAAISQSKVAGLIAEPNGWISKGIVNVVKTVNLPVWNGDQAGRFYYDSDTDELWMGTSTAPYRYLVTGPGVDTFADGQDITTIVKSGNEASDWNGNAASIFSVSPEVISLDGTDCFVYLNGNLQKCGANDDFIITDTSTVQFNFALAGDDRVSFIIITVAFMTNYTTKAYLGSTAIPSGASKIGVKSIGNLTSIDVQSAFEEVQRDIDMLTGGDSLTFTLNDAYNDGSTVFVDTTDMEFNVKNDKAFRINDGTGGEPTASYQDILLGNSKAISDDTGLIKGNTYYFKVNAVEYNITIGTLPNSVLFTNVILTLNTTTPLYRWDVAGGNLRCSNRLIGTGHPITLAMGTSGPSLYSNLTGFISLGVAHLGANSTPSNPIIEVLPTETASSIVVHENVFPGVDTIDLGSATQKFNSVWAKTMHIDANTLYIGDSAALKVDNGEFKFSTDSGATFAEIPRANVPDAPATMAASLDQPLQLSATGDGTIDISSDIEVTITAPLISMAGNIIPTVDNTYGLGSATNRLKNVYADEVHIGAHSLYVNGKKVIEDVSNTMTFATDPNQAMNIVTSGTGSLTLISENQVMTSAKGGIVLDVPSNNPTKNIEITNQSTGGNIDINSLKNIALTANLIDISGDVDISGKLTVSGAMSVINTQQVNIDDNIIMINSSQTGVPATTLKGGIEVERGEEVNYQFLFAEDTHTFRVGELNLTQAVATREDSPIDTSIPIWDSSTNKFITSASLKFNGTNLLGNATTASKLAISRTLSISGDASGTVGFDGSANADISLTIADNSHNHTSANITDATYLNTPNVLIKRDGSGNFVAGTITANLTGTASASTLAAAATKLATSRTLSLSGEATGSVGFDGTGNADIAVTITDNSHNHLSANITDATASNTASMIVKRDVSGNFSAGTITAALTGNASTATKLATARNISVSSGATGTASFDGSANSNLILTITDNSHNHTSANISDATASNTSSMLVKRDSSGGFNAGAISSTGFNGPLTGNATTATTLFTARNINGVAFNGSADITIVDSTKADHATNTTSVAARDARAVTILPQDYSRGIHFDFVGNSYDALGDGGTYNGLITFRQYGSSTDWTGGPSHQIAQTENGNLWHRMSSANTWGTWKKLIQDDGAGVITSTTFVGALTGNASTASALQTARTLSISSGATGSVSFDGSANANIVLTVTNNGHTHTSANITDSTNLATANMIVKRDASGGFSAGAISATDLALSGNLTVSGTTTTIHATTVTIDDNIIQLNSNASGVPLTTLTSGIEVNRGTSLAYQFLFRESDDTFVIGQAGTLQAVATREDTPGTNNGIPIWDNTNKRFNTTGVTISGTTISGSFSGNASTATALAAAGTLTLNGSTGTVNATSTNGTYTLSIAGLKVNASGNADTVTTLTKAQIEAQLTGAITTHTHSHTIGSTLITDGGTTTTIAGMTSITSTGFTGTLTGNASTATALAAAGTLTINGAASTTISTTSTVGTYTVSIAGVKVNAAGNADTVTGFIIDSSRNGQSQDYNAANRAQGVYSFYGAGTNGPGSNYSNMIHLRNSTDVGLQIVGGYTCDNLYFRGGSDFTGGTGWGTWRTVIHSGNISSQAVASAGSAAVAAETTATFGRTDAAAYPIAWIANNTNKSQLYSCAAITITSSTGAVNATVFNGAGTGLTGTAASLTAGSANAVRGINFHADATAPSGTSQLNCDGYLYATRVYNAVWNDLAEFMAKDGESSAGEVMIMTEVGAKKSDRRASRAVIGVHSDTFGYALGAEDQDNKVAIGLSGRVKVKVREVLEIGDLLVSDVDGFATKANASEELRAGIILGKVVENKKDDSESRIWMLILNR